MHIWSWYSIDHIIRSVLEQFSKKNVKLEKFVSMLKTSIVNDINMVCLQVENCKYCKYWEYLQVK